MKRVAVIGPPGAGKTTFARRLADKTGLPLIHLDAHFWNPGWVPTPREEWRARHAELLSPDEWIIDGVYPGTLEERVAAADTVIFLDVPRAALYVAGAQANGFEPRDGSPRHGGGLPGEMGRRVPRLHLDIPKKIPDQDSVGPAELAARQRGRSNDARPGTGVVPVERRRALITPPPPTPSAGRGRRRGCRRAPRSPSLSQPFRRRRRFPSSWLRW